MHNHHRHSFALASELEEFDLLVSFLLTIDSDVIAGSIACVKDSKASGITHLKQAHLIDTRSIVYYPLRLSAGLFVCDFFLECNAVVAKVDAAEEVLESLVLFRWESEICHSLTHIFNVIIALESQLLALLEGESAENKLVLGQCASLVAENILDLAELFG